MSQASKHRFYNIYDMEIEAPRGTAARMMNAYDDDYRPKYRPRRLTPEQEEQKRLLRSGAVAPPPSLSGLPEAVRRAKELELNIQSYKEGKPWLQSGGPDGGAYPIVQTAGGKYISFSGISVSHTGEVQVPSLREFIDYAEVYVQSTQHVRNIAVMQQWLAEAKRQLGHTEQVQISREVSNQNLTEEHSFSNPESKVNLSAKAMQVTKTVRFGKGFLSDCAAQERNPRFFRPAELEALSQSQQETLERLGSLMQVNLMQKQLPCVGDTQSNWHCVLNSFLYNQPRFYALQGLIAAAGSGVKSYTDDDGKRRSIGSNKILQGDFSKDMLEQGDLEE